MVPSSSAVAAAAAAVAAPSAGLLLSLLLLLSSLTASRSADIHFSQMLSFSAQKTSECSGPDPGWDNTNTRPAFSPSYTSKFFCKKRGRN